MSRFTPIMLSHIKHPKCYNLNFVFCSPSFPIFHKTHLLVGSTVQKPLFLLFRSSVSEIIKGLLDQPSGWGTERQGYFLFCFYDYIWKNIIVTPFLLYWVHSLLTKTQALGHMYEGFFLIALFKVWGHTLHQVYSRSDDFLLNLNHTF